MPLVLTINEVSASGHRYADVLGVSYEYPTRLYSHLVIPGESVIFYRGSRGAKGRRIPDYLGSAVVGPVIQGSADGLLCCDIIDYRPFETPLPFRDEAGVPYEIGGFVGGRYYQRGVRRISFPEYLRIMEAGPNAIVAAPVELGRTTPAYASSAAVIRAVDDYAVGAGTAHLRRRFPGRRIHVHPRNNPGFDASVTDPDSSIVAFAEFKGTQAPLPVFFLSEGERSFAERVGDRYVWICIFGIQLESKRHEIWTHVGPLTSAAFALRPWRLGWISVASRLS